MSYVVLSRKYRPQTFDEVVGQDEIIKILKEAIRTDRIAHAFLFCGPRGIGKTSCARIFAKSLNCQQGPSLIPCGKCPACEEITKGTSFDVLEIDGASNRGIDEIRELRENVKFAAGYGRYKIYIVDEVHMLTTEAFNALLKTLEEPPPHVKFIFATTEPNKVPATIISRCQRFDFKRIPNKKIITALEEICKKERIKIQQEALFAIAKAAEGSLRDSLSILDQVSSLSEQEIKAEDVFSMLGMIETQLLFELADALGDKDCSRALKILDNIIDKGKDITQLIKDMNAHFRNLMIVKIGGKALGKLIDYPIPIKDMFLEQSRKFTLKEILAIIDIFIEVHETCKITETVRMPFEIALARITYMKELLIEADKKTLEENISASKDNYKNTKRRPIQKIFNNNKGQIAILTTEDIIRQPNSDEEKQDTLQRDSSEKDIDTNNKIKEDSLIEDDDIDDEIISHTDSLPESINNISLTIDKIRRLWDTLTHAISKEKMSVATFLQEGGPISFDGKKLTIGFPKTCIFHKETLEERHNINLVERILTEKLNMPITIEYKIVEEIKAKEEDVTVKKVVEIFKGKVVNRWHN